MAVCCAGAEALGVFFYICLFHVEWVLVYEGISFSFWGGGGWGVERGVVVFLIKGSWKVFLSVKKLFC